LSEKVMPRKPRFFLAGVPVHVVQRGNNRQAIFFDASDYRAYKGGLKEGAERYGCAVHAYVLMTNHVHLLATPDEAEGVSRMMQYGGRRYVPYINHEYGRTGTLWEGRFKSSAIDTEGYLLTCMRYIELNPVRARIVEGPGDYPWSSYGANALGDSDELLTPHGRYTALGDDSEARRAAYRALFGQVLDEEALTRIRAAWQTGAPLGHDRFRAAMEQRLGCKVGHARRGRPASRPDD
jgi:putative transposase